MTAPAAATGPAFHPTTRLWLLIAGFGGVLMGSPTCCFMVPFSVVAATHFEAPWVGAGFAVWGLSGGVTLGIAARQLWCLWKGRTAGLRRLAMIGAAPPAVGLAAEGLLIYDHLTRGSGGGNAGEEFVQDLTLYAWTALTLGVLLANLALSFTADRRPGQAAPAAPPR